MMAPVLEIRGSVGTESLASTSSPRGFALLWTSQFVATAGLTVIVPLLPFYFEGFGLDRARVALWTGVTLIAPAVTQALTGPLWGWFGDRYGRKPMVIRAQLGLAVAVGLMAIATSPEQFLVSRLLQGAFGGMVSANAAFASSLAAPHRQGRTMGSLFGATGAGSLAGPLLGSLVASQVGFNTLFITVAVLMVVISAVSALLLTEPRAARQARHEGPLSVRTAALALARITPSRNLMLAGFLGQTAVYALIVVFAPRVEQITATHQEATVWVGALQAVTWAAALVGAVWWGRRNDQLRPNWNFAFAALGCAIAVAAQGIPADPVLLLPLRLAQGFCFAALAQSVLCLIGRLAPEAGKGSCLGIANTVIESGQILGPLVGWMVAVSLPAQVVFPSIGLLFIVSAGLAMFGGSRASPVDIDIQEHIDRQMSKVGDRE
ncbi:MAG: MFS transporter [Mycobacterium sp.]|nr:MFS transporter [Mycobacterium sp.]